MKSLFLVLGLTYAGLLYAFAIDDHKSSREILLKLPLMSDKNAAIISDALNNVSGIKYIEACYELNVLIIGYDSEVIMDEKTIMKVINQQTLSTNVEMIYASDIPKIRQQYRMILISGSKLEFH